MLFNTERSVITKHLRNVFKEGELASEAVCAKFAHTAEDGKIYQTAFYNLDAIISVGYRVNSKRGTQFRIWATNVLREHLVRGVTINRQRIETNAREMEAALELARRAVASPQLTADMGRGLVEVIAQYTQTFLLLQRYDEGLLTFFRRQQTHRGHAVCGFPEPEPSPVPVFRRGGHQRHRSGRPGASDCGVEPQGQGSAHPADHEHAGKEAIAKNRRVELVAQ